MTKESEFLAHQELSKGLSTRTKPRPPVVRRKRCWLLRLLGL